MEQLTTETGSCAISRFNKMLTTDFKADEGTKWIKIDRKHQLVQHYVSLAHPNMISEKKRLFTSNKQFYACSGTMYKQLLLQAKTTKGVIMREYFSLIESLAQYQHEYIRVMNDRIMRKQFAEAQAMFAAKMTKHLEMSEEAKCEAAEAKRAADESARLAAEAKKAAAEASDRAFKEEIARLAAQADADDAKRRADEEKARADKAEEENATEKKRVEEAKAALTKRDETIASLQSRLEAGDIRKKIIEAFKAAPRNYATNEWLYVLTTPMDALINRFEVGITNDLKKRLAQYKTMRNPLTNAYYCFTLRVHRPKIIEDIIKVKLADYQILLPGQCELDETYYIQFAMLLATINDIHAKYQSIIDDGIHMRDTFEINVLGECAVPPPITDLSTEEPTRRSVETKNMFAIVDVAPTDMPAAAIRVINQYIRDTFGISYDYEIDSMRTDIETMIVIWVKLHEYIHERIPHGQKGGFKSSAWRRVFEDELQRSKNIKFLKQKPKLASET